MKKTIAFTASLALTTMVAQAQSIDFNMTGRNVNVSTETGYSPWTFGRQTSATESFVNPSGDTITITIGAVSGLTGNAVRTNYWKTGVETEGYKLVGDMAINIVLEDGNNDVAITEGSSGIELQIKGLKEGEHTLMAYHSNTDNLGESVAPLDVLVNGETVATGIKQRCRGITPSTTPYSYIRFNVVDSTATTIVQYITKPEDGVTYASTAVALNALVFDKPNPLTMIQDPYPSNGDTHVDADEGTLRLSWSPSQLAVRHHVSVRVPGEEPVTYITADTCLVLNDIYTMNDYYWRVDEEAADGTIYQGDEMSFRARQLAFPDAEGYGRFAQGGRGGVVYHVTNLNHDHNPGSLLYGLTDLEGPRTIVFDVSGIIEWDFGSVFSDPYVTIAAQTAPGKGICLKYCNLGLSNDNICRFLRAKRGYGDTGNALGLGNNYVMVDHCTAAWGTDETVSGRGAKNISFQYNIIAEALGIADHKNYAAGTNHGYAATIDGKIGSWHHNLLVNCEGRNWSMGGGMDGNNTAIGQMDIFNNVCYNWYGRTTDGGCHEVNFVNNYYKMGIDTKKTILFSQDYENIGSVDSKWQAYISGNIRENKNGSLTTDKLGDTYQYTLSNGATDPNTRTDEYQYNTFVSEPFFPSYAVIHSAKDAFKIVNSFSGAYMPCQDDQHKRVVSETVNGTYTFTGSRSGIRGEIDNESDAGGFEDYPEEHRADDFDPDQDGIPTWFETIMGTDPQVANNNADTNHDGWTELEDYLEFMSHPYTVLNGGETAEVDVAQYFAGFTSSPVYTVSSADGVAASITGSVMTLQAGTNSAVVTLSLTVTDGDGTSWSRKYNVAVSGEGTGIERLTVKPATGRDYDLMGRTVRAGQHGLLIRNGKVVKL